MSPARVDFSPLVFHMNLGYQESHWAYFYQQSDPTMGFGRGTYTSRRLDLSRRATKPSRMEWVGEAMLDRGERKIERKKETFKGILLDGMGWKGGTVWDEVEVRWWATRGLQYGRLSQPFSFFKPHHGDIIECYHSPRSFCQAFKEARRIYGRVQVILTRTSSHLPYIDELYRKGYFTLNNESSIYHLSHIPIRNWSKS